MPSMTVGTSPSPFRHTPLYAPLSRAREAKACSTPRRRSYTCTDAVLLGGLENLHPDPRVRHFLDEAARDSLQRAVGGRDPGWTWILPWQRWADAKTYADAST